jgi:hypothetical protein
MLTLRKIENVPTGPNNRPKLAVKITGTSTGLVVIQLFGLFDFVLNCRMWRDVRSRGVGWGVRLFLSMSHMVIGWGPIKCRKFNILSFISRLHANYNMGYLSCPSR